MRRSYLYFILISLMVMVFLAFVVTAAQEKPPAAAKPDFAITASYIEACSCDMQGSQIFPMTAATDS